MGAVFRPPKRGRQKWDLDTGHFLQILPTPAPATKFGTPANLPAPRALPGGDRKLRVTRRQGSTASFRRNTHTNKGPDANTQPTIVVPTCTPKALRLAPLASDLQENCKTTLRCSRTADDDDRRTDGSNLTAALASQGRDCNCTKITSLGPPQGLVDSKLRTP